jgi:hypothetical protein
VLTGESPTDHQYFLQAFTGLRDVRSTSLGVTAETPRGDVQITESRPFEDAYGIKPPVSTGLRFGAVIFSGDDKRMREIVSKSGVVVQERHDRLIVHAHGAVLAFEAG